MKTLKENILYSLCLIVGIGCCNAHAASVKANIDEQSALQHNAVKSQKVIEELNAQTIDLIHEYQQTSEQLNTLQIYNQQLEKLINSQEELIATRTRELNSIEQTEQSIVPLMLQMITTLEQFIRLDMPFLLHERQQRVHALKVLMDKADVTSAEKYRQILEAYLIEMDFGRTIEAWQGVHPDDDTVVVNYFRMGRVALVYQSLDKKMTFYWSKDKAHYKELPIQYRSSLERGFRVAKKQTAPEFVTLPVSIPEPVGDALNE